MLTLHLDAMTLIEGYKAVLLEVLSAAGKKRSNDIVNDLASARSYAAINVEALSNAIASIRARGATVDAEVEKAIEGMRFGRWFHLRHTAKYAVLLDAAAENAYPVKALTNPLHEIAGGTAMTFEAGVFEYKSQYVCDGIVRHPVHLGPGIRAELNQAFARIKAAGQFHLRTAG